MRAAKKLKWRNAMKIKICAGRKPKWKNKIKLKMCAGRKPRKSVKATKSSRCSGSRSTTPQGWQSLFSGYGNHPSRLAQWYIAVLYFLVFWVWMEINQSMRRPNEQ